MATVYLSASILHDAIVSRTSTYLPPLTRNFFSCRSSPASSSSSILLFQSALPVHSRICSPYEAIDPFIFDSRSMSRSEGDSRQPHVGAGHVSMTGTGGGADGSGIAILEALLRDIWSDDFSAVWTARRLPWRKMNMLK